jgi:hypothetical protein
MKWFTEPSGKFVMRIPTDWRYMNVAANYQDKSPFCFEPYEEANSSFQISCYSSIELKQNPHGPVQQAGTAQLKFIESIIEDEEFRTKLWFASVDDHTFIAKFVYSTRDEDSECNHSEMAIVTASLSSLRLLTVAQRQKAIEIDRYEKFMASLSASFDIKNKALESDAVIEFMVITANQIDAYLRMALVLKKQLDEQTDAIDIALLFQGDNDTPVMERAIYKQALSTGIIDQQLFDDLDRLYKERNKVIHRYIITDLKIRDIYHVAGDYHKISERVRLKLKLIEDQQSLKNRNIQKRVGLFRGRTRRRFTIATCSSKRQTPNQRPRTQNKQNG